MLLTKIQVDRFKRLNRVSLSLSDLNILVGANGSGKSSFIQAIHLASCLMRQASEVRSDRTSPVSIGDLDYIPTDNYWELGHNHAWGNRAGTPSSKVTFIFQDDEGNNSKTYSEFRSARNAGISVTGSIPPKLNRLYRGYGVFFSSYIPGISGIPNQESKQSKRVVQKACSFGDANVYLRNVLDLLELDDIRKIEGWISEIIGDTRILVTHNNDRDLFINARVLIGGNQIPLELLGMGYLQLIQIFAYILLFKPQILLIDEPDIHLHPDIQQKLSAMLSNIAVERKIRIFVTTHSPFIVRGAPIGANVVWIDNGEIKNTSRESIQLSLGWGAFGKKILLISEDKNVQFLRKLLSQWPDIEQYVAVLPGEGYRKLLTKEQAKELRGSLGNMYHIVIHRDRDSLTENEMVELKSSFNDEGISLWLTDLSDIESYFCLPDNVAQICDLDEEEASRIINDLVEQHKQKFREIFIKHRRAHNQELYQEGGSPENSQVKSELSQSLLVYEKGKVVFKELKNKLAGRGFTEQDIILQEFDKDIAISLKDHLRDLLDQ